MAEHRSRGHGHGGVVKLLLGREDVTSDRPDSYDRAPLWWAARMGREVVKLLLEREDVNPNMPNKAGNTPLSMASSFRHKEVVKLLQARISSNRTAT